jgi:hypothetical protein
MKNRKVLEILVSLVLIVGVVLSGCSGNGTSTSTEYLKATAVKRGINFSFEYPASYTKLTPDAFEDNGREPSVSLLYTAPGSTGGKADIQIYIIASSPLADRPDAAAWAEVQIKMLEQVDEKFKLYENSTTQVSGINGYKIVYYTTALGNYLNSHKLVCRDAYIDYKEYIWKISVLSVEEMGDQGEPVFQHLLESFKFLD